MTPAELVRTTRERKGVSQRRLALRAGTSQSAVARIERADEEVTWPRLRALMLALGEEPVLTSRPVPSRYDADDLLRDRRMPAPDRPFRARELLGALAAHDVDFVVVGGIAAQAHGYIRSTRGLDVVPQPSPANSVRLSEALSDLDGEALGRTAHALRFGTRAGRLDIVDFADMSGAPSSYDDLRARALVVAVGGFDVAVAGLDDLVRMKRASGRPQDLMDIGALTRDDEQLEREAREST